LSEPCTAPLPPLRGPPSPKGEGRSATKFGDAQFSNKPVRPSSVTFGDTFSQREKAFGLVKISKTAKIRRGDYQSPAVRCGNLENLSRVKNCRYPHPSRLRRATFPQGRSLCGKNWKPGVWGDVGIAPYKFRNLQFYTAPKPSPLGEGGPRSGGRGQHKPAIVGNPMRKSTRQIPSLGGRWPRSGRMRVPAVLANAGISKSHFYIKTNRRCAPWGTYTSYRRSWRT
jgi:hypothetical protein